MDEPIAPTDSLQKHSLSGVIEETGIVPGDIAIPQNNKA
jgi:hypothetical protein